MSPNQTAAIRWMPLVGSPRLTVVGAPLIGRVLGLGVVGLSGMAGISNNQFQSSLSVGNVGVVSGLCLC